MQETFVSTTEGFVKTQIATLKHDASHDWRYCASFSRHAIFAVPFHSPDELSAVISTEFEKWLWC